MQPKIQTTILRNLLNNEDFARRVIPYIKKEYFEDEHRTVFNTILSFVSKFNKLPTKEALLIELDNANLSSATFAEASMLSEDIYKPEPVDIDWLMQSTEKWVKDRSLFLAIMKSIGIMDGKEEELSTNAIPDILSEALSVTFDQNIGHDYINDADKRYEFYHRVEEKLPFDLDYFNKVTSGGLPNKSLNILLAGTGVGKSMFMCHHAASVLTQGKNVLYLTMEMAEERIAERIDANLMNMPIQHLSNISKSSYEDKIEKIAKKSVGRLIIKEYPTGAAHAGHFRALLKELVLKKKFKPEIIFIDYLNICASSRMKMGGQTNSYTYVKAIAEELRGLAVEFNVPIFSATQTTRSGYGNSDVELTDTSESFGLPATADFMFALIANEELDQLGQLMVKILKNRYNDPNLHKRFVVGVDRSRMKFFDVEENAQTLVNDVPPPFDTKVISKDKIDFSAFKM
jgi:replicative DNA helicase